MGQWCMLQTCLSCPCKDCSLHGLIASSLLHCGNCIQVQEAWLRFSGRRTRLITVCWWHGTDHVISCGSQARKMHSCSILSGLSCRQRSTCIIVYAGWFKICWHNIPSPEELFADVSIEDIISSDIEQHCRLCSLYRLWQLIHHAVCSDSHRLACQLCYPDVRVEVL